MQQQQAPKSGYTLVLSSELLDPWSGEPPALKITARPQEWNEQADQPRMVPHDHELRDFQASSLTYLPLDGTPAYFCQPTVEYSQPYVVRVVDAQTMLRVLTRVTKGLDKMEQTEGYAGRDFGIYLLRVGRLTGCTHVAWQSTHHNHVEYHRHALRDVQHYVATILYEHNEKHPNTRKVA